MRDKPQRRKRRFQKRVMVEGVTPDMTFDYKDVELLRKFVSSRGKIFGRSRSGLSAKQQRDLTQAIKRARMLAMLAFAR